MTHYSEEFKASVIARMLPPHNEGIAQLAQNTGVPRNTLYTWRSKLGSKLQSDTRVSQANRQGLSSEEKFTAVIESASLNEVELSEYCRRKGLYPEQIQAWSKTCMQANATVTNKADKRRIKKQARQLKQLESELRRKDKALAETAALLVLQKKVQAIWGDPEDEKLRYGSGKK
jgi:transposase